MTEQHEKIYQFCKDGSWHCQNEFRENYIFSPHKRRAEMSQSDQYFQKSHQKYGIDHFETRPCEHGTRGQRDYRIVWMNQPVRKEESIREWMDRREREEVDAKVAAAKVGAMF